MIVQLQLERVKRTAKGQGIELEFSGEVINRLAELGYVPEFGARELRRQIQNEIETPLAQEILSGNITRGTSVLVDYDKVNNKIIFSKK